MFHRCKTIQEAESLYIRLAFILHPSRSTGSFDLFAILQESFSAFCQSIGKVVPESKHEFLLPGKYQYASEAITWDNLDESEILNDLADFAKENKKFEKRFLNSLIKQFNEKEYLTANQYNALVKIYYSFDVGKAKTKESVGNEK